MTIGGRPGIPVRVDRYAPVDSMIAVGANGETPSDWADMGEEDRFQWCISHGATILMHPDMYARLKEESIRMELFRNDS